MTRDRRFSPKRLVNVDELPSPEHREPGTLYFLKSDVASSIRERDRILGVFMDQWSQLEFAIIRTLSCLQDGSYERAHIIFANTTTRQICELITGLGRLALLGGEQAQWARLARRVSKFQTQRNHLVHGAWQSQILAKPTENQAYVFKEFKWARVHFPRDPKDHATIEHEDQQSNDKSPYYFSIKKIRRTIKSVSNLRSNIDEFATKICERLHPENPTPE